VTDVQISTGVSQWDLPTSEAPIGASSSHSTPAQATNPYHKPDGSQGPDAGDGTRGMGGHGESTDRAGGLGVRSTWAAMRPAWANRNRASQ
jgi:hypothetical protein